MKIQENDMLNTTTPKKEAITMDNDGLRPARQHLIPAHRPF